MSQWVKPTEIARSADWWLSTSEAVHVATRPQYSIHLRRAEKYTAAVSWTKTRSQTKIISITTILKSTNNFRLRRLQSVFYTDCEPPPAKNGRFCHRNSQQWIHPIPQTLPNPKWTSTWSSCITAPNVMVLVFAGSFLSHVRVVCNGCLSVPDCLCPLVTELYSHCK